MWGGRGVEGGGGGSQLTSCFEYWVAEFCYVIVEYQSSLRFFNVFMKFFYCIKVGSLVLDIVEQRAFPLMLILILNYVFLNFVNFFFK
jgi:hypothetical protein